jgi:hypothetical protein
MHKNISSKTPKARLNVDFSNSDCGINQFQGTDSVRPDPKHTQRSNKILFEHDPSFFLAYSDCLTSFRDIGLHPSSFFRSNFEISKKMYTKPNFSPVIRHLFSGATSKSVRKCTKPNFSPVIRHLFSRATSKSVRICGKPNFSPVIRHLFSGATSKRHEKTNLIKLYIINLLGKEKRQQ